MAGWFSEPSLETIVEGSSPIAWLIASPVVVGTLYLAAFPGGKLFGVRFWPSLIAYLPTLILVVLQGILLRRRQPPVSLIRVNDLFGCAAFQFFPLYLVSTSKPVGMATFGAIFLLIAVYQGSFNRATVRRAPAALVTPLALAAAFAVAGSHAPLPLLALGLVGSASAIIAGGLALDLDRRRRENEVLRAAVQAQIDAEREQTLSRFRESVVAASGHTHDMANQVQATAFCVATLGQQLGQTGDGVAETLADLRRSVGALEELVRDARAELRSDRAHLVEVDRVRPAAGLAKALLSVGRRFPRVHFSCTEADPSVVAALRGGQTTLVRILENLLANACEGDGTSGAASVQCAVRLLASRSVVSVEIRDDGPGFSASMLERGIEGLATTKAGGTGLGLYTVERQLRASGGELRLANRPEGGAEVVALLPAAPDPPRA